MFDFIRLARKPGFLSSAAHVVLNLLLALGVIALTVLFNTILPAVFLVILSKWRIFAVRPRYWWANILSSVPDLVFSFSIVILSWQVGQYGRMLEVDGISTLLPAWSVQLILGIIYAVWLILIKPKNSDRFVKFQASASQFIGLLAIFFIAQILPMEIAVILAFIVATSSARQMLGIYKEKYKGLISLAWGLIVVELVWISWHWSVYYSVVALVRIPQVAIIVTAIAFVASKVYGAWHDDRKIDWDELGVPSVMAGLLAIVILFGFSGLF